MAVKATARPVILVLSKHTPHGWTDQWGVTHTAETVSSLTVVRPTEETHEWHNGYGPQVDGVWVDRDGLRFRKVIDEIGGMGARWLLLEPEPKVDLLNPATIRPAGTWNEARPRVRYVDPHGEPLTIEKITSMLETAGYLEAGEEVAS